MSVWSMKKKSYLNLSNVHCQTYFYNVLACKIEIFKMYIVFYYDKNNIKNIFFKTCNNSVI